MPLPQTEIPGRFQAHLAERGIRMTDQRRAILSVIEKAPGGLLRLTLGISGGAKRRHLYAVVTPRLIQAMTRCARARSCMSRLPCRATHARVLPRQEEIAARLAA
jgi:hypothetical protein